MKFGKSRSKRRHAGGRARFAIGEWPHGLPKLYPDIPDRELSQFLDDEEFRRILALPKLVICPIYSRNDEEEAAAFGTGLSLLLIRDLMLIRNLSVLGPEDTPPFSLEEIDEARKMNPNAIYVSGSTTKRGTEARVELQVLRPGGDAICREIGGSSVVPLVRSSAMAIAELTQGDITADTQKMWRFGRPRSWQGLIDLGALRLGSDEGAPRRSKWALEVADSNPDFALPFHELDTDHVPDYRQRMLDGLKRDPYDAQLHFLLALVLWESRGPQPEMVQYVRKCVELSPGHGKAHMCAPHAAHQDVDMLRHSELGYRLLPGNPFAVSNYALYLQRAGRPTKEILAMAEEGIQSDPYDPSNYERLIELCLDLDDLDSALKTAERLQNLYEPRIHSRTLYCLQQNPAMAKMLDTGEVDPAASNGKRIEELKSRLRNPSTPFGEPPSTNIASGYRARVEKEESQQGENNWIVRAITIIGIVATIILALLRLLVGGN